MSLNLTDPRSNGKYSGIFVSTAPAVEPAAMSCYDVLCADNYNYSWFKLTDKCRNEKWELYLYGDMTIKVDRDIVDVLPRGVPHLGSSSNLATDHTLSMCCACLLSVAWV